MEIIFDRQALINYNAVFRFLMRIKRANYVISHRDYWVRMRIPHTTRDMNDQEQLVVKNKIEFNKIMHKMQIFQREVMNFTNNLECF